MHCFHYLVKTLTPEDNAVRMLTLFGDDSDLLTSNLGLDVLSPGLITVIENINKVSYTLVFCRIGFSSASFRAMHTP